MIDARVFRGDGRYYVELMEGGENFDIAGPFDDADDAVEMARRSVTDDGTVYV